VDVIVHSADFDRVALKVLQDARHIRVDLGRDFLRIQKRPAILRRLRAQSGAKEAADATT
jgi:hypothetical protein